MGSSAQVAAATASAAVLMSPGPHHLSQGAPVQRLLDREHGPGLDRVGIGGGVVDEVVLGQPGEALLVDVEMRQGRTRRPLLQQGAERRLHQLPPRQLLTNRWTNASALSAVSRQPLSMISACPWPGSFSISVTPGLSCCCL